jgi:hypothetical protein
MHNDEPTAAEKLLNRLKNNRWIAGVIVLGVIIIAASNLGQAISKLAVMLPSKQRKAEFDAYNREKVLEVAKDIDDFFSRAIAADTDRIPFPSMPEELRKISVELRDLELRDSVRPLNTVSTKQIQIVRENWDRTIELFRKEKTPSPTFLEKKREQEREMFSTILAFAENYNEPAK